MARDRWLYITRYRRRIDPLMKQSTPHVPALTALLMSSSGNLKRVTIKQTDARKRQRMIIVPHVFLRGYIVFLKPVGGGSSSRGDKLTLMLPIP